MSLSPDPVRDVAAKLARGIFTAVDDPHDKVQRIQFMGGTYPDKETDLGGMDERALTRLLARLIKQAMKELL
jgi:hypothetical protein